MNVKNRVLMKSGSGKMKRTGISVPEKKAGDIAGISMCGNPDSFYKKAKL
jgi:hypothetical protein